MDEILGWGKYVEKEAEKAKTIIDFKANDICCHCGKKVGGYYVSPEGYYYLSASFIGCSAEPPDHKYRLCVDCFKIFKEVTGGFFKTEGDK